MIKFFSAPLLLGIILGILFPYQSLSLIWLSSFLLFALLFVNTLSVDERQIWEALVRNWREVLATQFLTFVFFPVLLTATASQVFSDRDFVYGFAMSSLAPSAIINPFFAQKTGGDPGLTLVNVWVSTLLCPFVIVPVLKLMGLSNVYIDPHALTVYITLLTCVPIALSLGVRHLFPRLPGRVQPTLAAQNSLIVGLLMFILVGSSLNRLPLRLLLGPQMGFMFVFYLAMDFGIFILARRSSSWFLPGANSESMSLSVATRNFAAAASLMLFFYPKAALPSAVGLIVHCLFFQWLVTKKKMTNS